MKEALGLLEVAGLAAAIKAADVMVKAANVRIIDVEKARGNGWMMVKVSGDVGAVQAAVQAGVAQAKHDRHYIAQKVIPRPAEGIDKMLLDGGGKPVLNPEVAKAEIVTEPPVQSEVKPATTAKATAPAKATAVKAAPAKVEAKAAASTTKTTKTTSAKATEPVKQAETVKATTATAAKTSTATKQAEPVKTEPAKATEAPETTASGDAESVVDTTKEALLKVVKPAPKKRPSRAKTTTKPKA